MTTKAKSISAVFLLGIFSLNTLVTFACSFGGFFHSLHHQSYSVSSISDLHSTTEHHGSEAMHHEHNSDGSGKTADCCSDQMTELEKVDKTVTRTIEAPKLIFLTSFIAPFTAADKFLPAAESPEVDDLVRWRILTTIPDTRIVIQSFQI